MTKSQIRKITLTIAIIIGVIAFAYVFARATLVSFTYDEAYTYMHQINRSVFDILTYNSDQPANIHLFMTLAVKLIAALGGTTDLVLRLPSVLAFAVYVVCSYLLARRLQKPAFVITGFILLLANPFVLEFFSLARGYSISLALMMVSLVLLAEGLSRERPGYRESIIGLSAAALAVISNLNWLFFYGGLIIAVATLTLPQSLYFHRKQLLTRIRSIMRRNLILISCNLALIGFMLLTVWKLKTSGALYFGGSTSFWTDTMGTLIKDIGYGINPDVVIPALTVIVAISLIYLISLGLYLAYRRQVTAYRFFFGLLFTLIFMAAGEAAGHFIFNVPYQTDRTAIAFIPVYLVCLSFGLWIGWEEFVIGKTVTLLSATLLAGLALALVLSAANFTYTYSFKADASTKAMLQTLATYVTPGHQLKLGMDWEFESVANFYRVTENLTWLPEIPKQLDLPAGEDYYYIGQYTWSRNQDQNWQIVQTYPLTGTMLVKVAE